jgi:hypothetical protein
MARRDREINIFNIAFLDVITGAMGAFVLLVVLLSPYVKRGQEVTQQNNNAQQAQQAQQDADEARKQRDQAQQQLQQETEQSAKQALDRAEQNIQQADQAMQTDDVEELKRLLAQARADLAEARKQLDALNQELQQAQQELKAAQEENAALQQRLDQAVAQVDDLRKQLQAALQQRNQALAEADQARQQAVAMQDTLDHSQSIPTSWALADVMALPTCGAVQFKPYNELLLTDQFKAPSGFAGQKDTNAYIDRSNVTRPISPGAGDGSAFHMQYFLALPFSGTRLLFGMQARLAPPPGCRLRLDLSITVPNGDVTNFRTFGTQTVAVTDTRPVLLFALPAGQQGVAPTSDDMGLWQKDNAQSGGDTK